MSILPLLSIKQIRTWRIWAMILTVPFYTACGGDAVDPGPAVPFTDVSQFSTVNDILQSKGCGVSGCHEAGGTTGKKLKLYNDTWANLTNPANPTVLSTEQVNNIISAEAVVDYDNPPQSLMLIYAAGGLGHPGGGPFFLPLEESVIVDWINSRNPNL